MSLASDSPGRVRLACPARFRAAGEELRCVCQKGHQGLHGGKNTAGVEFYWLRMRDERPKGAEA